MPDNHVITVRAADTFRGAVLLADCSCGVHIKSDDRSSMPLADLYEAAVQHTRDVMEPYFKVSNAWLTRTALPSDLESDVRRAIAAYDQPVGGSDA